MAFPSAFDPPTVSFNLRQRARKQGKPEATAKPVAPADAPAAPTTADAGNNAPPPPPPPPPPDVNPPTTNPAS